MRLPQKTRQRRLGAEASVPIWPKSAVRIGFGLILAIDAAFKWRPGFHRDFLMMIKEASEGQPSWLHGWFKFWINTMAPHPHVWAYSIAVIETLLALALIFGFARKTTYILTAIVCFGIWTVAEGFGGPYTSTSTDIGAAVMYAVVAASLLVLQLQCGTDRYSADYYLEQKISWWHWVAEFGAHNHPARNPQAESPAASPALPAAKPT
jgi:nitrite reductase (NO-forming)